ncbi:MAG: polyphenol oxidase family protein [Synergistaceae bacterium]|nr:polyphenol oxidase family protein [Synergistaceae bacterium]
MSFGPIAIHNGQRIQRIRPPKELEGLLEASLFLRGPVMDRAGGDPETAWQELGGPAAGIPLIAPIQVHGTAILEEAELWTLPSRPKADGILLSKGKCAGSLRFADCFPLLLASCHPRPWALMLHAGFEGTAKGILSCAVDFLRSRTPGFRPDRMAAWIGPGIGPCCYERKKNQDAKTALGMTNLPRSCWTDLGDRVRFDIREAIRIQLLTVGLPEERIFTHGLCTSCNPHLLYSYRNGDRTCRTFFVVRSGPAVHNIHPWWENI